MNPRSEERHADRDEWTGMDRSHSGIVRYQAHPQALQARRAAIHQPINPELYCRHSVSSSDRAEVRLIARAAPPS